MWLGIRKYLSLTLSRRCDADGNGYISGDEFRDLCQEFEISQVSPDISHLTTRLSQISQTNLHVNVVIDFLLQKFI